MPQIAPKLIAPELIDEINVEPPIAVHVRNGQARAMIVMDSFVVFGRVIHGMMFKAYAALFVSVEELEIVKSLPSPGGLNLLLFVLFQRTERIFRQPEWVDDLTGSGGVRAEQGAR